MGLFTKAVTTVARALGLTSPQLYHYFAGVPSYSGKMVNVETAMQLDTVWACVRLVSQTVATLPLQLYRADAKDKASVAKDHPLYRILHDRPNAEMTATEFWEAMVANVLMWGNAYAEISRGPGGRVTALTPMRSDRVMVQRNPDGSLLFTYSFMGQVTRLEEGAVFHLKGFSLDGIVGLSPITLARHGIGSAIAAEEAAGTIFKNGMRPSGYLAIDKFLTREQRTDTRELVQDFSGSQNTGKVPVLEGGIKFTQLQMPPEDMQLLETRSFHVEQICRWFDVPPIMIGHMEKSTAWGTGMEQMMLWFLTFSLRPHLKRIEHVISKSLLGPTEQALYAEFNVEGLMRADSRARAELYSKYAQNGLMTRNEIRALENLGPLDGGDELTVQSNLLPIKDLGLIATMPKEKPVVEGEAVSANPDPGGPPGRGVKRSAALDEARDALGKWIAGSGTSAAAEEAETLEEGAGAVLRPAEKQVFSGAPVETQTKLSKLETGAIGERVAIAHLKQNLGIHDAGPLNSHITNYPIDISGDHIAVEVKTGLVSNGKAAQQWRATIGQPGKSETEWLKTASADQKSAFNEQKRQAIMSRKKSALAELEKTKNVKVAPKTLTTILNPDTKTVDLFMFDGFHSRIPWNSPEAKKAYVGTYHYA